ncbi:MAG: PQQ-dependent sugar dehydrogenase, partial [Acidimicrobiales bacterium]
MIGLVAALVVATCTLARPLPAQAAVGSLPVATGLAFPAAFTVAADRLIYGERFTGAIRVRDLSTGNKRLLFTVPDLATTGEQGLLGIEVHPDYPATPFVYAFVTRRTPSGVFNQVVRITDSGGAGTA